MRPISEHAEKLLDLLEQHGGEVDVSTVRLHQINLASAMTTLIRRGIAEYCRRDSNLKAHGIQLLPKPEVLK